jgi:hypothetical protein
MLAAVQAGGVQAARRGIRPVAGAARATPSTVPGKSSASAITQICPDPPGRGVVLLHHAGRDAPAAADRDALLAGPGPEVATAPPGG